MSKKIFLLLSIVLLLIFATTVHANSTVEMSPIKNNIALGENAKYQLTITNGAEKKQGYSIYSLQSGQGWNVDPFPLSDKIFELGPGQSRTTTIQAQAFDKGLQPGIYYVQISISSTLGESYTESLKIYLNPEKPMDYLPTIKVSVDMDEKINPKDPVSIKLFLENRNPLDLSELKVKIQSDMPEFVKELNVNLPPLEKKTVEFTVNPNLFQQPKEYILFFVFEHKGEVAKVTEQRIEIISLLPEFKKEFNEENKYLKVFQELTVNNDGNVKNTQKVKHLHPIWKSLFTTSNGKNEKIDGKRYLVWEITLSPNESTTLNYVTNYRILVYILGIILIFASFYFYVQSPITANKSATTKKGDQESLSEIKITLEVKNKSKKPIKNIDIIDLVPGIANVEKSLELGTLRPKEVRHTKKGTKVIWSLTELDAHEHRLITYKVRAKLNIVGTFILPRATIEYSKRGDKRAKAYSNIFRLSS